MKKMVRKHKKLQVSVEQLRSLTTVDDAKLQNVIGGVSALSVANCGSLTANCTTM